MPPEDLSLDDENRAMVEFYLKQAGQQLATNQLEAAAASYAEVRERAQALKYADLEARAVAGSQVAELRRRLHAATAAVRAQQFDEARAVLDEIRGQLDTAETQDVQAYADAMLVLAQQEEYAGRTTNAMADLDAVLTIWPHNTPASTARVKLVAELQRQQRARRLQAGLAVVGALLVVVVGLVVWRVLASLGQIRAVPAAGGAISVAALPTATGSPPHGSPTHIPPTRMPTSAISNVDAPGRTTLPPAVMPERPTQSQETGASTMPTTANTEIALEFTGVVQRDNGERFARFAQVELWGGAGLEPGQVWLDTRTTDDRGAFVLETSRSFEAYWLWVRSQDRRYRPIGVTAGPDATPVGSQAIRYIRPASGEHGGNLFVIGEDTPKDTPPSPARPPSVTATHTVVATAPLAEPERSDRLPKVTLLSPAPDFSAQVLTEFVWKFSAPIPADVLAEVVLWREGERPAEARGVAGAVNADRLTVHLAGVPWIADGTYFWTVILVRLGPYERLTLPSEGRRLYVNAGRSQPS